MTNQEFHILVQKYKDGTASEAEKNLIEEIYNSWSQPYSEWDPELMGDESEIKTKIFQSLDNGIERYEKQRKKVILYKYISAVASIVILIGIIFLWYPKSDLLNTKTNIESFSSQEALSTDSVILTLENGKKIDLGALSVGQSISQRGVSLIKKSANSVVYSNGDNRGKVGVNILSVPKGRQFEVTLTDGTVVWLNAASELQYPLNLQAGDHRKVMLRGEGYFEVSKDKYHPFIVTTKSQEINVLGTHFNVKAYADEPTVKTTLLEGSVQVKSLNSKPEKLSPGQQSTLLPNGNLSVRAVDTETAIAWKNKNFIFESERIETIMRMIERRYNVQVYYNGEKISERFSGGFPAFDHVAKVLASLESTGKVHFKTQGKKIYVFKSSTID
ncbi:FecR domain-containing protein [Sphingobacterium sp.]|uniref:FecR family protein n=1 Tax=Sphingobacterium sp. TaxID=341027 RepID=UPI0031DFF02B